MVYTIKKKKRIKCLVCKKTVWTNRKDRKFCSSKCCLRYKYLTNRDKILDYNKNWAKENTDKVAKYHRKWLVKNRKKWNKSQALYRKKKYHENLEESRRLGRERYKKYKGNLRVNSQIHEGKNV